MDQIDKVINELFSNNARELQKICNKEIIKFGGVSDMDFDDFYSRVGCDISIAKKNFDPSKGKTFKDYVYGVIKFSIWKEMRHRNREKRQITFEVEEKDSSGNISKHKEYVRNISIDAPTEDGINLCEKVASDFNIEKEVSKNIGIFADEKVELFLSGLSNMEQSILRMKMQDYTATEIKEILCISDREYNSAMKSISMNENLSMFTKNINDGQYKMEECAMGETVMGIITSDNYKMDKYSLYSLLEDKKNGEINCKYILQRKPFQWTNEEVNRFLCRILSNLPIPEIIICEQNIRGMSISHLIDGLQRLSYAESFKENRISIGKIGAERHLIQYREFIEDENGNRVLDEDGLPMFKEKVCDVIGKKYKDLPKDLKKRFNNFNINVTKFFNCTDQQIADHIRDYNNHAGMNREQGGLTKISTDVATKIKNISDKSLFFKNCGRFTESNRIKGKLERVVAESIMLMFYKEEWKSNLDKIYQHINTNATGEEFETLKTELDRLANILVGNKEINTLFTTTTTPMWVAVFNEFIKFELDDRRFVDFLNEYNTTLKNKEINGISMNSFEHQQTKKKTTITGKIDLLVKLMKEYLHIDEENLKEVNLLNFVKENVNPELDEEDVELYEDCLDSITVDMNQDDEILDKQNKPSLLALIGYAINEDKDYYITEWFKKYLESHDTYILNQKENFINMRSDLDNYVERLGVA